MPYTIAQDLLVNGTGTFTGNVSVPAGTTDSHVINKLQFDTAINDIRNRDDSKPSVKATVTSGELNETLPYVTARGVTVDVGDRVLYVAPVFAGAVVANGPYVVQTGTWVRADDGAITNQSNWRVEEGSDAGIAYVVTTPGTIILGTTPFTIVPIAAAASLIADSLGSTEIVDDEIRVKISPGTNVGGESGIRIEKGSTGIYINVDDARDLVNQYSSYFNSCVAVAKTNVDILTTPSSIDGVTLTYAPISDAGNMSFSTSKVLLANQTNPLENGLYACYNDGVDDILGTIGGTFGSYYIKHGSSLGEIWHIDEARTFCKRLSSPSYFQTLSAGVAATHTITHNKLTTRPQVRLFDTVTNEELFAQPSNISSNSFDLVLSALANDVQVVVNITPDA